MIIHKIQSEKMELGATPVVRREHYQRYLSAHQTREQIAKEQQAAKQQSEQLFAQKKEAGVRLGQEEAKKELTQQHLDFCRNAIDWTEQTHEALFTSLAAMVEKVIGDIDDDKIIKGIVRKTLLHYVHLPELKLLVAPAQHEVVLSVVEELKREKNIKFITVEADERLQKGDCFLESPLGSVNASLDNQLTLLKNFIAETKARPLQIEPQDENKEDDVSHG